MMYKALKYFNLTCNGESILKMVEGEVKDLSRLDYHTLKSLVDDGFVRVEEE